MLFRSRVADLRGRIWDAWAGELVHVIADAHIYDRHVPMVEALLRREPYPAPAFHLDPTVDDFYAFTPESVSLEGYRAHPMEEPIPVAI